MRNLLITGAAGFIGVNFLRHWLAHHPKDRVVVLDALTYAGNIDSLPEGRGERFTFVEGSITDETLVDRLMAEHAIDTIVNFAAESHVDRSISGPDIFIETNIIGTHTLLKCARRAWKDRRDVRFHHVSTDEVYGSLEAHDPAFTEETPYAPNSPYSASKAGADHIVRAYFHTYGLPVTTSNCSNNYGPYHFPEKLIPLMIVNALHGRPLPVYGDGLNIRDWLYVEDHCRGIELVLEKGKPGENYNIGGNNEWTNIDIVKLLCRLIEEAFAARPALAVSYPACPVAQGKSCSTLIKFVTDRPGHDRRYAIDASKSRRELGYEPRETFETGIRKTIGWYLDNTAWWQPLLARNEVKRGVG